MFCASSRIMSSWFSTSDTMAGTWAMAAERRSSSASSMAPRARAVAITRQASVASWQVKALVEATPISGPARVGSTRSASRAMELSGTLTMPSAWVTPAARAPLNAASVSAGSPDCEMVTRNVVGRSTLLR